MWGARPPARSTLAAAVLTGMTSLVFAAYALTVLASAGDGGVVGSRDAVLLGLSGREEGVATMMIVGVILGVSALALGLAVGVLRRARAPATPRS